MKLYKVTFDNNKPVSATLLNFADFVVTENDPLESAGIIKWLPVFGLDEQDSIDLANKVIIDLYAQLATF